MCDLADAGVVAGETGAAALAGLVELTRSDQRESAGLHADANVLVIVSEGATDQANYERIVGRSHRTVGRVLAAADVATGAH